MPVTKPHRRIVHGQDCVEDAITKAELTKPEHRTPDQVRELTYEQRLQRQIDMLNSMMSKYERKLNDAGGSGTLNLTEEKTLLALIDSARKLELAMAQIRAKTDGEGAMDDLELALIMLDKGVAPDVIKANFAHNPHLPAELDGAIRDRQE